MTVMGRSKTDLLFSTANSIDIIVYVHRNPGCRKTMIYREVVRNAHTSEKLQQFVDEGILVFEMHGRRCLLRLTEKGDRIAEHLIAMKRLMNDDS